jgi:DNA-binding MarR family transcriptional regulator
MPSRAATVTSTRPDDGPDSPIAQLELGVSVLARWIGTRHVRARIAEESGLDLSPVAVRLLEHLLIVGPLRVSEIAECEQVDKSTATVRVQALQRDGLVERTPDSADARVSVIAISAGGRQAIARLRAARRLLLAELFGDADPDELARLGVLLQGIQLHMTGTPVIA